VLKRLLIYISVIVPISAPVAWGAINFIYPSPNSAVTSSGHLIFKLNQSEISSLRITHNGLVGEPVDVGSPEFRKLFQDIFIAQSLWDPGVNNLVVDLFNGGQKIESAPLSVFYEPVDGGHKVLPEYAPVALHRPEKERFCTSCHVMNPTPEQMNSSNEKNNPCIVCHKRMLAVKYVHGPAGTYSCGYCHDSKGTPKHSVPKRGAALCYECHSDMEAQLRKKKFLHGPVEAGMCEACHDPHGSQNESQLLKEVNDLCLSCHGHIRTQVHVVRIQSGESHPLKGKSDPAKKGSGREMSCVSCHSPHGGTVRYFFVNNSSDRMQLCQMCHNM
jgi:predicted CXXCH cytochrome family protein